MGYDMRIVDEKKLRTATDEEIAEAWRASKEYDGGDREKSSELWLRAYRMEKPEEGYFRLNIWGMGSYRYAMAELGMMHWSNDPVTQVEWPDYPEDDSVEDSPEMEAYNAARDELTARHGDSELGTIPSHKFCSNDGWIVTPDEIHEALKVYELFTITGAVDDLSADTKEIVASDYWGEWIDYLKRAEGLGGFRVW